jgi:molybdopterin synthase catalytic subunit
MRRSSTEESQVLITNEAIDTETWRAAADEASGAAVTFSGVVRDQNQGRRVTAIRYECYHEMAQREAERIADEIRAEFDVDAVRIAHRVGELLVGDVAMFVVVTAAHRSAAFTATQALVDRVKERVPIWKKERYAHAPEQWL